MTLDERWWEREGNTAIVDAAPGFGGAKMVRLVRAAAGPRARLAYPKLANFPRVPCGYDGGHGPTQGENWWGLITQPDADYPVGDGVEDLLFQLIGTPDPTSSAPTPTGFFADPAVSSGGDGSVGDPWPVPFALQQTATLVPGSKLWIRGGSVGGSLTPLIQGAADSYVEVRAYPGETVHFTGHTFISPSNRYIRFRRINFGKLSGTPDDNIGVDCYGLGVEFWTCSVHDAGQSGSGSWDQHGTGRWIDTLFYNNGTHQNLDHGTYINSQVARRYDNCVFWNNLAYGVHGFSDHLFTGLWLSRIASFDNGYGNPGGASDIMVGPSGAGRVDQLTVEDVVTRKEDRARLSCDLGYVGGSSPNGSVTARNILCLGGFQINRFTTVSRENVVEIGPSDPVPNTTRVWPSLVTPKYSHIVVVNGALASTVPVNISTAGLAIGDAWTLCHVFDPTTPVASGTYDGNPITVPMDEVESQAPLHSPSSTITTGPEFGVFILRGPDAGEDDLACPDLDNLRPPMLALSLDEGSNYRWVTRSDANAHPSEDPDPTPVEQYVGAATRGEITYWVIHWIFALDGTGRLEIWRVDNLTDDYTKVVDYTGPTGYNETYPAHLEFTLEEVA